MSSKALWEILVPAQSPEGSQFDEAYHKVWDDEVKVIAGGLTVMKPGKGTWISPDGGTFREPMIPVRVWCDHSDIMVIANLTAKMYDQRSIMLYKLSDLVIVKNYD